jgi:hypothetical protein
VGIAHLPGLAHTGLTELTARRDLSKLAVRAVRPRVRGGKATTWPLGGAAGFAVVLADDEQARVVLPG